MLDDRRRTLMAIVFLSGLLLGIAFGWWFVRCHRKKPPYLLHLEYWVYLPGDVLPAQDEVMMRLVESNAIGRQEALLFSDVRLHIALVLRSKNVHVFRPDLLESHIDASSDQLEILSLAHSLAKVRFLSEEPVPDRRYLTFLPQVARVVGEIGGSRLVYDVIGERLIEVESLKLGDPGPHVRWVQEPTGGHIRTHGLRKRGVPEIRTALIAADERWIVSEIVGQVAKQGWDEGELPSVALAEAFEDRFQVGLDVGRDGIATARVHRIQEM